MNKFSKKAVQVRLFIGATRYLRAWSRERRLFISCALQAGCVNDQNGSNPADCLPSTNDCCRRFRRRRPCRLSTTPVLDFGLGQSAVAVTRCKPRRHKGRFDLLLTISARVADPAKSPRLQERRQWSPQEETDRGVMLVASIAESSNRARKQIAIRCSRRAILTLGIVARRRKPS
jgi:hypothetical protein